ncbi:MAG: helix-turn-helix domain-containing protein, partial [Nanoarchaeota archaeon]|nr:helix-turn-helix domain-containing protein [Nanoarchaeota archaeon]
SSSEEQQITFNATEETKYQVKYETPAPTSEEQETSRGKIIKISGSNEVHYQNVLAFTTLPKQIPREKIKLYLTTNNAKESVEITNYIDEDNDGLVEKVEWIVPQLSEQTYELIIEISKAEHLDSNKDFISDIYEQVNKLDDVWSEPISANEYVRVTFKEKLDSSKDITIFPRIVEGDPTIKVYEAGSNEKIAEFRNLAEEQYNKILLTNLKNSQDSFDLKITGGSVEFDYIVDPISEIIPMSVNENPAYNGTLNDNLLAILTVSKMFANNYRLINKSDSITFRVPSGSSSADTFVAVNFTIPAGYYAINVSTRHNLSITSSARTGIALWNFTNSRWKDVLNTTATAAITLKSYNLSISVMDDFVSNNEIRVMVFDDSGSISVLAVDKIWVNVTYATLADNTKPDVQIRFPSNHSNWSNVNLDVNYTRSDNTALFNCWYSNDTYLVNISLGATCENITSVSWSEGYHNVTVWANDSAGSPSNYNASYVSFTIDTIKPEMNIVFPLNNSNWSNANLDVNFSRSANGGSGLFNCWYSNDTYLVNISLATCDNITNVAWTDAQHNVTIWVNDSAGNYNWTGISFKIDTIRPDINITFPLNNSQISDVNADVNYTRRDTGSELFNCWYSNDTYLTNISLSNCENITTIVWTTDSHNVTVWANDSAGNYNWSRVNFTIASANEPPEVRTIYNTTASIISVATTLNAGPNPTSIEINFSAYDPNDDLNDATASINVSLLVGSILQSRANTTCYKYESQTNLANYTCNVTMWWYDGAGTWIINASVSDLQLNSASNVTANFSVGATTGFEISPGNLTWSTIAAGMNNQTATNDPILINNTGNQEIGISTGNISINATDLKGETDSSKALWSGNFSVSSFTGGSCSGASCLECAGSQMNTVSGNYANITNANLTRGNFTLNNKNTGQEELYICLRYAGRELPNQAYSTQSQGVWTIKVLLVAFTPALKKKRKKKSIKNDKLLKAFNLIAEELKQEYSLNKKELLQVIIEKLKDNYNISRKEIIETISKEDIEIPVSIFSKEIGALESVTKYMKENLNMNYHEIARELGRDERTIWTSYKKAKEKQKEPIKINEDAVFMPVSIFKNKKLTILESIILHLKEKGMKYSEIAELLNRDQRNIWTIYSRAIKK